MGERTVTVGPDSDGPPAGETLLEVRGLSKSFEGNKALDRVSLDVGRGEIVALLGHNGSGKSTLVKCLSGVYAAEEGRIQRGAGGATALHFIHQNLGLVPSLTVTENLSLVRRMPGFGLAPALRRAERARARAMLEGFGSRIDPDTRVGDLTQAQKTIVAIVRALDGWRAADNVLVLDEPTATLHEEEVSLLLHSVRRIAGQGAGVIYISHRLAEVETLADRAVVLKNGHVIARKARGEFDAAGLARLIAGAPLPAAARAAPPRAGEPLLEVRGLASAELRGIDVTLHPGEILGIAGLVGSGMEEVCGLIYGSETPVAGDIRLGGQRVRPGDPGAAIRAGLAFVPADRRRYGGIGTFPARENLVLPRLRPLTGRLGAIDRARENTEALAWMARLGVQPEGAAERRFDLFSGGNQQKIVVAKWLRTAPRVLLLNEPTQGVDAGAQAEIHRLIAEAAREGMAILVASSDTEELADLCHRVLVLRDGRVGSSHAGAALTESALVASMLSAEAGAPDLQGHP